MQLRRHAGICRVVGCCGGLLQPRHLAENQSVGTAFHGSTASLRPAGIGRYFAAAFLLVWLTGWAAGEVFALGFLAVLLRSIIGAAAGVPWPIPGGDWIAGGAAGFVLLFLLAWVTLWTVGGVAAITHLLRSLAGEDRVEVQSGGLDVRRRAGPFGRTRRFERAQIRRVRVRRHDKAVVLDTLSGSEVITEYGTPDERRAMADWLRGRLLLPETVAASADPSTPPPGWQLRVENGTTRLTQDDPRARAIAASIMWVIVLLLAAILYGAEERTAAGVVIAGVLCALAAAGAIWMSFSRRAWLLRHGELTRHTRFLNWERAREFKSARLEVTVSRDSDNDSHYRLEVIDAQGTRRIASEIHDETAIVVLGQWLAARTGFPLKLPHRFD
jgi:hypothetical protein